MFNHGLVCTDFTDGLDKMIHFVSALGEGGFKEITFYIVLLFGMKEKYLALTEIK